MASKYLVCALLITGAAACDKEGFTYDNIVDNPGTEYLITDSVTLNMSTVYMDSIPTSNMGVALCGINNDPVFGKVSASSYWQVKAFSGTTIPDLAVFDSMVLMVHPQYGVYGDTLQPQHIEVYRVTQEIKKPSSNAYLYSNYSFSTESTPLGSRQMVIRPYWDTVYKIRLNDVLGKEFFTLTKNKSQTITDQTRFSEYFRGLALKPGANSRIITPFRADDSLNLRMYYHTDGSEISQSYADFAVYNSGLQFNHVDYERVAGSPLTALNATNKTLPSTSSGNKVFVQPLTNLIARIDMPYLKTFTMLHEYSKIMRATLTVRPERLSYLYPYTLPPALTLCEINSGNQITDTLASPTTGAVQYGSLVTDLVYNVNTAYTYDITNYCIAEINSSDITTRGLALVPPRTTGFTNFARAILGDVQHKTNRIEVKIYYLRYK
jgi:hypothetical protein